MAINYPTSLDALTNPVDGDKTDNPNHADQHANENDILEALEAKVGVDSSAVVTPYRPISFRCSNISINFRSSRCIGRNDRNNLYCWSWQCYRIN